MNKEQAIKTDFVQRDSLYSYVSILVKVKLLLEDRIQPK